LRILLINYEYPPIGGGAANATWYIARELNEMGHNAIVLTSSFENLHGWKNEDGVFVYRCKTIRKRRATSNILEMLFFFISASYALIEIVKQEKIQGAIIFFLFPCGPLGLLLKYLLGIPYVISLRGGDVPGTDPNLIWIHQILKPIRRLIYKKAIRIVPNSEGLKAIAQKYDPISVTVIPNGIDTNYFCPIPTPVTKLKMFKFLYVGRFKSEKNLKFIIKQAEEIKKRSPTPFIIKMVGDGGQKEKLKKLVSELHISDCFKWYGWLEKKQLKTTYQSSDCLIMPSLYEGMSNAILEAMACGVPIVASRVSGNVDLVEQGKTGFLFDNNDPESFIRIAVSIMKSVSSLKKVGLNGRQKVENWYSWSNIARQYMNCFYG
jgi:glycosyltransferase involved in cell wall biosynthesis